MSDLDIKKIVEINAPIDAVFIAITNPDDLTQWFPDQAILDHKVGGKMKFTLFADGSQYRPKDSVLEGEILEFVPNKRLSHTWTPTKFGNFPRTIVTWDLEAMGKNKTRLTLTHTGFTDAQKDAMGMFVGGWNHFVGRLAQYCEGGNVMSTEIKKIIEIDASPKIVFDALTRPEELIQWFPDQAIFEAKVDGKMHFSFLKDHNQKKTDHYLDGEILESIQDKKLVYTFKPDCTYKPDDSIPPVTVVTWSIEPIGNNKTRVTLIHTGFTKEMANQFKETTAGWNYFTARLVQYCKKKSTG